MGASSSSEHCSPPSPRSRRGHDYSDVNVRENARAQLGDSIHNGNVYITHFGSLSQQKAANLETSAAGLQQLFGNRKRKPCDDAGKDGSSRTKEHTLGAALDRLGRFSTSIQHQRLDEDANETAQRLLTIVDALRDDNAAVAHVEREWNKLRSCVVVADRIVINPMSLRRVRKNIVKVDRKRDTIAFGHWRITLTTAIFHSRDGSGREATESASAIRVDALTSLVGPSIAVFLGERTDFFGTTFIHPVVLAYRNVSNESRAFRLLREDDADGLLRSLALQETTTRDCDEQNRSLLYVRSPMKPPG